MNAKKIINLLFISVLIFTCTSLNAQSSAPIDFTQAAEKSVHAVVHIQTEFERKNSVWDDFFGGNWEDLFDFGFQRKDKYPITASGSGVIISEDGYIVTNNHVVEDANRITVTLNDKREYEGTIVGTDKVTDLALIKINDSNLPYLTFGNSDNVKIGEWVLAVGNPFNLTSTVTAGIVSAKARNLSILGGNSTIESFIQTDAAVNRGNSGGALVNTSGELIGINSAIASGNGYYTGYSFAIPSNIAKKVVGDLKTYGKVQYAYLGINIVEIDASKAEELGLDEIKGIYIGSVQDGSAAEKSGIKAGDILRAIDGFETNSMSEVREILAQRSPGDIVKAKILRNSQIIYLDVELLNNTGNTEVATGYSADIENLFNATFSDLSKADLSKYKIDGGVKVVTISQGALKNSGIKEGFIITGVNHTTVNSVEDMRQAVAENDSEYITLIGFYSNKYSQYSYTFQLP